MRFVTMIPFLFCLNMYHIFGQTSKPYDKIIFDKKTIIESRTNEDKSKTLKVIDAKSGQESKTLNFSDLENGLLSDNPLGWDVVNDSLLFLIRTYSDHLGMTYTDLLKYNIDTVQQTDTSMYDKYLSDIKRITVKHIAPIFMYALRIAYNADTLKGPLYYDLHCNKKELAVYIYIGDNSTLEKWIFSWYPALIQPLSTQEIVEIHKRDQWQKVSEYAISLKGTFKVFEQARKTYIITQSAEIYYLDSDLQAIRLVSANDIRQGDIIIIDKEKDQIRAMEQRLYDRLSNIKTKKSITKSSKKIVLKQ
jgi:hypothetical protein